jgi:hypothetical protein
VVVPARARLIEALPVATRVALATALATAVCGVASALGLLVVVGFCFTLAIVPTAVGARFANALEPRGLILVALLPLTFVPLAIGAAFVSSSEDLLSVAGYFYQALERNRAFILFSVLAIAIAGTPVICLWWCALGRGERPRLDRSLRVAAWMVIVAGAVLAELAALRHRSRPDFWRYVEQLPTIGTVTHGDWQDVPRETVPSALIGGRYVSWDRAQRANTDGFDLFRLTGTVSYDCQLWLVPHGARATATAGRCKDAKSDHVVRWDERHRIYVIPNRPGYGPDVAFSDTGRAMTSLHVWDVRTSVAAPWIWIAGSTLGLSIATVVTLRGIRLRKRELAIRWVSGWMEKDGTVVLSDGERLAPTELATDRAIVTTGIDPSGGSYRSSAVTEAETFVEEAIAQRRARAHTQETAHAAWAISLVFLTSSPLLAFMLASMAP